MNSDELDPMPMVGDELAGMRIAVTRAMRAAVAENLEQIPEPLRSALVEQAMASQLVVAQIESFTQQFTTGRMN